MAENWMYSFVKFQDENLFFSREMVLKKILDICFFLLIIIHIEKMKITFSKVGKKLEIGGCGNKFLKITFIIKR